MNSQVTGLKVAAIVFWLMALGQAARLTARPDVLVAGAPLPLWPSAVAFIILAGLGLWMWRLARLG